jgi:hypothetical protein
LALVTDSENEELDISSLNGKDSSLKSRKAAIKSPPIEREVKIVEFTEQHEHVRRQRLLESMKSKWSKYDYKKTKEQIREKNAKRTTTKEQNRKHVKQNYLRKR